MINSGMNKTNCDSELIPPATRNRNTHLADLAHCNLPVHHSLPLSLLGSQSAPLHKTVKIEENRRS